jgi:hypothetical protein
LLHSALNYVSIGANNVSTDKSTEKSAEKSNGIREGLKGVFKNVKQNIMEVKNKLMPNKIAEKEIVESPASNYEVISFSQNAEDGKVPVSDDQDIFNSLSKSIMKELRPSLEDNLIVAEDYFGKSGVRRQKRSTSTSRLQDEDEYEQIGDFNYILTEMEWREFLLDPPKKNSDTLEKRIVCSIKCGLPGRRRGEIWEYLVKVKKYKSKSPEMYLNFLEKESDDNTGYTISKDILRTFPENPNHKEDFTTGKNKLYNVLKAYSTYDTEVKYCQGMNFIVFLFLENLQRDEERTFWLLVSMMKHHKWRKLYKLDTPKLMKLLEKLKKKMRKEVEDIYLHLLDNELPIEGVFAPYFITLFLYSTPVNIAEKIID